MQANEAIQEKILWIFDGTGSKKKIGCCNSKIYPRLRASDVIRT